MLAERLYNMTDDPGMKDMLSFLIARDTMHQQQWLAVIEELGGLEAQLPIPNSVPEDHEARKFSYVFMNTSIDKEAPEGRWTAGPSLDGKAEFSSEVATPMGQAPSLGKARPDSAAQKVQMKAA